MRHFWLIGVAGLALAQGTTPKEKPGDYEVTGKAGDIGIGAEYLVHSFSRDGKTFFARDYLVVEVALFPPKGGEVKVDQDDFELRVDGRKPLLSASAAEVASALDRRNWSRDSGLDAQAQVGVGDKTVILGAPGQQPPYGPPQTNRLPRPPRAPEPDYKGNVPEPDATTAGELAVKTALGVGKFPGAVSGYLYFFYKGNAAKIRTVALVYRNTVLKLK